MNYTRMPIEIESPEEIGYSTIQYNLAESSVRDIHLNNLNLNLNDLLLCYGHHQGHPDLLASIASESTVLKPADVLVCSGAATALFIVATTLLSENDHLVVVRPNYGTNLETPRAINCAMSIIDLTFEEGFSLNIDLIQKAIQPNTRLISITNPHNPTGTVMSEAILNELVKLAEAYNCYLLVDETYRYLNFQTPLAPYLAEKSKNVISVSSLSKAFGVPGIRIGWIICQDASLMHQFLAAKEQIMITNSVVDEQIALHILQNQGNLLSQAHQHIRTNFAIVQTFFAQSPYLDWVEPTAGVVCFPRLKAGFRLNTEAFYKSLYANYQTLVGPGHWFEQDKIYMRIGFGYPTADELTTGLQNLERCLGEHLSNGK
ncbi:aminotransferase class I/II-fold pyridoxal phosphate-dependent enzyme [Spirosoma sp. KCTC 42546]|uniref:aminotransferase class I/II-fold pyridoxal phosphate-dependent enzyme n=1 Tax=Spirosoma sp. KCTC 42546 TaxID=2520506 RepID=UPI00115700C0|nr:aminotransferase class I/II-fold pyridoxal phosphate-dependent enzyme [Spirosoma sp. KCTC 42546]QDK78402.1 aminotransferase class I/II-fold pyridoxal phosphate-dependent enzyme [Spirosoma sp. KCTC 42546]